MSELAAIHEIDPVSLRDTFVSLMTAFVLGALIGYERQFRQRIPGLRTNVLVALVAIGAALFVDFAQRLYGPEGAIRVGAYVVSGIGFLGAGLIMREGGSVVGLNTAATLWCSAAIGACAGGNLFLEAILATVFVLSANILLRPIGDAIDRRNIAISNAEGANTIHIVTLRTHGDEVLSELDSDLKKSGYPITRLDVHVFGRDELKIEVELETGSIDTSDLNALVGKFSHSPVIRQIYWRRGTGRLPGH